MRRSSILIAFAALLAVAAPADAAPGWSAPRTVPSAELKAHRAQAAVDAQGRAVVAWQRDTDGFNAIRAAVEESPGQFAETQTLSTSNEIGPRLTDIGSDDAGNAIAVWCSTINGNLTIRFAERLSGTGFGGAQTLLGLPATSCADLAVNRAGEIAIAWTQGDRVALATEPHVGGPFDLDFGSISPPPATLQPAKGVAVALDDAGTTRLAWHHMNGSGTGFRIVRGRHPRSGAIADAFASPGYLGTPGAIDIAVDSSLAAIWTGPDPANPELATYAVSGGVDGLGPTSRLGISSRDFYTNGLSVANGGAAFFYRTGTKADTGDDPQYCPYRSRYLGWASAGQAPQDVSIPLQANPPETVDGISAASDFVAWRQFQDYEQGCVKPSPVTATSVVRAAQANGSTLAAPVDLSDSRYPATDPSLNASPRLAAAWTCFDGRKYRIQVSTYGATAGEPLWCGPEDLDPPKVKVSTTRYPLRWRSTSKPSPRASCHEQCTVTVGLLMFSRGHRAAKLGVSEQVLNPNKAKRLTFPKLERKERRLIARAVKRRSNVRLVYRLRFDDLAANSVLKTARVRLY